MRAADAAKNTAGLIEGTVNKTRNGRLILKPVLTKAGEMIPFDGERKGV